MVSAVGTPFEQVTSVERVESRPGSYRGLISDEWNAPVLPQGGITTSIALRAMAAELDDPSLALRSTTTAFVTTVAPGPVDVDVTVLRRGRSMSQVLATVKGEGADAGHTTVGIFGVERPGFTFTNLAPPVAPPPGECTSVRESEAPPDRPPLPSFWAEHVEFRPVNGHPPWEAFEPDGSALLHWYRFDESPFVDGHLDDLALVTLCDTMPGAVGHRMGGGMGVWYAPSCDLTVHLLGCARSDWLLGRNRARHAGDGYASLEMELWDEHGTLVAYATQMMLFSFPEGPPSPEERIPRDLRP
jgi:acyl-CoA thioesterase